MKVKTTEDSTGLPSGSVLQNVREVTVDGVKCYRGVWASYAGTYLETVPQNIAEVLKEE